MNEENQVYFVDSDKLPPAALERKAPSGTGSVFSDQPYGVYGGNAGH